MACECRDGAGNLLDVCAGLCQKKPFKAIGQLERDPMNGFAELILGQVNKMIENKLNEFQVKMVQFQIDAHQKAFIEGLKEGIDIGKDNCGRCC